MAKLGDFIVEITEKTTENNQYPVLTSSREGLVDQNEYFNKQVASKDNTGYKIIHRGQFTYRAMSDTGKFYINQLKCNDIGIVSPAYPVFEVKSDSGLSPEYLQEYFRTDLFQHAISLQSSGSTRVSLKLNKLKDVDIAIPSMVRQDFIVNNLARLRKIIENRRSQLCLLDELVKSRFIEMFGDPVYNQKGWETQSLESICKTIVDCPHSTPRYTDEDTGYMCIRTSIVKKNVILWDKIEYISEEEYLNRIKRKKPEKGDIIYTREGAILGIAAIIDRECNVALGQRSMLLSPDTNKCISRFLSSAMNFDTFFNKVTEGVSGSASPHINVGSIKKFEIILPPLDLQNQFADFVVQVDKSKLAVQKSLEQLEILKKALMQAYFG